MFFSSKIEHSIKLVNNALFLEKKNMVKNYYFDEIQIYYVFNIGQGQIMYKVYSLQKHIISTQFEEKTIIFSINVYFLPCMYFIT